MRINPAVVVAALFLLVVQPPCVEALRPRWPMWKANEESKDDEKPSKKSTPEAPSSTSSNTERTGFEFQTSIDLSDIMGPGDVLDAVMEGAADLFQSTDFQEAMKDREAQEELRRHILFVRDFFTDNPGSKKEGTNTILDDPKAWSAKLDAIADKMAKVTKEKLVQTYLETFDVSAGIIS